MKTISTLTALTALTALAGAPAPALASGSHHGLNTNIHIQSQTCHTAACTVAGAVGSGTASGATGSLGVATVSTHQRSKSDQSYTPSTGAIDIYTSSHSSTTSTGSDSAAASGATWTAAGGLGYLHLDN